MLSDREIFGNLQAIVKDADKTPVLEVCHPYAFCFEFPIDGAWRSLKTLWASLLPNLVKSGLTSAKNSENPTSTTSHVCQWWNLLFSWYALMMLDRKTWPSCVEISCVVDISLMEGCRLGRVRIGGMTRYAFRGCGSYGS